jgi:lipopolysaccharide transport system ATP-binding protein
MSKPVIEIKNLSKSYMIGHEGKAAPGTLTLRDSLTGIIKKPIELLTGHKLKKEKFWALKGLDLNIEQGDVVGLIGKNGSGKSTMLKILSRIVEPTGGEIIMRGKSASLLEVGTGFHPELTGRENIYFNGSILGMKKKEIDTRFDEIVAFSGVDKFLDTAVKFYSSGMYVRLAFAVAAHLEPDILIVDEVLAVGDAEFQKKSLGKMRDVTKNKGRTVIFVSHNMESIASICNKCVWLQEGKIVAVGDTDKVIDKYVSSAQASSNTPLASRKDRQGSGRIKCIGIDINNKVVKNRTLDIEIRIKNTTKEMFEKAKLSLDICDQTGNAVSNLLNYSIDEDIEYRPGMNVFKIQLKDINLVPGNYPVNVFVASDQFNGEIFDWVESAALIKVPNYDVYNTGMAPSVRGKYVYIDYSITGNK